MNPGKSLTRKSVLRHGQQKGNEGGNGKKMGQRVGRSGPEGRSIAGACRILTYVL